MSKMPKTGSTSNPRRLPRTQADVEKAYKRGMNDGLQGALTIMLYVMRDKFSADDSQLEAFADAFNYTVDSINRGYISTKDLQTVIKDEYGTTILVK